MGKWDTLLAINLVEEKVTSACLVKDRLYFRNTDLKWVYEHEYLWAIDKLEAAACGEVFDVPVGHEGFMERVFEVWENSLLKLDGEVYYRG